MSTDIRELPGGGVRTARWSDQICPAMGRAPRSASEASARIAQRPPSLQSVNVADPLFDAIEREQLCDLLDELGPLAPTLLDPWTTHDIAAQLVLREHDFLAAPGLIAHGAWGRFAEPRRLA